MKLSETLRQLSRCAIVVGIVAAVIGPISYGLNGNAGLAWGLGWAIIAGVGWTLFFSPRWGLAMGVSAGLCAGVGFGSFTATLGLLGILILPGLFWGVLGGFTGLVTSGPIGRVHGLLVRNFVLAVGTGILGTILAGMIGHQLGVLSKLSGALFGVFFIGPSWAVGVSFDIGLGRLVSNARAQSTEDCH